MRENDNNSKAFLACHGSVSRIWRLKGFTGGNALLYSPMSVVTVTWMLTPQVLLSALSSNRERLQNLCLKLTLHNTCVTAYSDNWCVIHICFSAHCLLAISANRKLEPLYQTLGPLILNIRWTRLMLADLVHANKNVQWLLAKKKVSFPLGQWPGQCCL